jgi:hypothetical protein
MVGLRTYQHPSYFSEYFNVHGVNDVRHIEKHTAVFEPSSFEVDLAIEKIESQITRY